MLYQAIDGIGANQEYTVAVMAYAPASGCEFQFIVNEFDNNSNYIDTLTIPPAVTVTAGSWNFYQYTFTSSDNPDVYIWNAGVSTEDTGAHQIYFTYLQCAPGEGTGLNNPAANGHDFLGSLEMRGMAYNLQQALTPPMCIAALLGNEQGRTTGSRTTPSVAWDTIVYDNMGGMGLSPAYPEWYVVTVPGFYEIEATVGWAASGGSVNSMAQAWICVAIQGMQEMNDPALENTPWLNGQYGCPIGETTRWTSISSDEPNNMCNPCTRMFLGVGDMVAICCEQSTGVDQNYGGTTGGGSHFSIRWVGHGTEGDWVQVNSSINGGTIVNPGIETINVTAWKNTGGFSYSWTASSKALGHILSSNKYAYQGKQGSDPSAYTFIPMPSDVRSILSGQSIHAVTLTCTNYSSYDATGAYLILGAFNNSNGAPGNYWSPFTQGNVNTFPWTASGDPGWWFNPGETRTVSIPTSFISDTFVAQSCDGFFVGTDDYDLNTQHDKSGVWWAKPNTWILTVAYSV